MSWVISMTAAPCCAAQPLEQRDDLRLHRDVERGGRLVGDDQLGLGRERERQHDALAHAAGELVRIVVDAHLRRRDADLGQQRERACRAPAAVDSRACVVMVSISWSPMR